MNRDIERLPILMHTGCFESLELGGNPYSSWADQMLQFMFRFRMAQLPWAKNVGKAYNRVGLGVKPWSIRLPRKHKGIQEEE